MENTNDCPICFESLTDKTIGSPDVCDHKFCLKCLEKWSKLGNFCPVDRQRFKKIRSGGTVIPVKYRKRKKASALYDVSVYCEICKVSKEENDTIILCDTCDLGFHFVCLEPPLKSAPKGNWHCPDCQEITRNLKAQKTKTSKDKSSTSSKHESTVSKQHLNLDTKKTSISLRSTTKVSNSIDQCSSAKTTETKLEHVKQSSVSKKDYNQKNLPSTETFKKDLNQKNLPSTETFKKDYNQKNLPSTETINAGLSCTKTQSDKFEDFFSISENDVVLTNRKPLSSEMLPLPRLSSEILPLPQLRHTRNNLHTTQKTRKTKRLAAVMGRMKMIQNHMKDSIESSVDDSSSSSGGYSSVENSDYDFADMQKTLHHPNSTCDNQSASNSMDEFSPSKSRSESDTAESITESIKENNTAIEDLNKKAASYSFSLFENPTFSKASNFNTGRMNRTGSLSVFEKPGWKSFSASTKNNKSLKVSRIDQIPMATESFSDPSQKSTDEEPPELILEPLNLIKNPVHNIPPKLAHEPLSLIENTLHEISSKLVDEPSSLIDNPVHEISPEQINKPFNTDEYFGNEKPPTVKETVNDNNPIMIGEYNNIENRSSSEAFTLSGTNTDTSCTSENGPGISVTNDEETHSAINSCQVAENDNLSHDENNYPEINAVENTLNNFHIREVHYAIKAKINLPEELQKIERQAWQSSRSKSRKRKYRSHKKTEICISSSSQHIISGNSDLYDFLKNTQLDSNKSTQSETDLVECSNFLNPFCQSVSGPCPKKLFKVTEYALQPSNKQVCFNEIPKDALESFVSPGNLKHLDIREDGSLFLNWFKSN